MGKKVAMENMTVKNSVDKILKVIEKMDKITGIVSITQRI